MGRNMAGAAFICGVAGLPLLLLSYAWVPFALMGREEEFVFYAVVGGEVGALVAAVLAVGLGIAARRGCPAGTPEHRRATRGLLIGALVFTLVLAPNILGSLWTR